MDDATRAFIEQRIDTFHETRLQSLQKLQLRAVLRRKNPYLFRAKNMNTADSLVRSLLDAHLSSQEEGLFGAVLENLAVFLCERQFQGRKSSAEGIDLEFFRDGIHYLVAIKSGPNWGNSGQIAKMKDNFKKAKRILNTNTSQKNVVAVNGCCYGRSGQSDQGEYLKLCGQGFWELISGIENLYIDIIEPLGYRAREKNDAFDLQYAKALNRFVREFTIDFCDASGAILWERILKVNAAVVSCNDNLVLDESLFEEMDV